MSGARVGRPRIGELFAGYGGLGMGVQSVFGGDIAWVSDIDTGANKILAHRFPDIPNHGDITTIDWSTVEPVDILTGGYPCQPFSQAGRRAGAEDPRHLWPHVATAVGILRPPVLVFENVRGHLTLGFDEVLRDLSLLHYDVSWTTIKAASVGAPHNRARVFILGRNRGRQLRSGSHRWGGLHRDSRGWRINAGSTQGVDDGQGLAGTKGDARDLRRGRGTGSCSDRNQPRVAHLALERQESCGVARSSRSDVSGEVGSRPGGSGVSVDGGLSSALAEWPSTMVRADAPQGSGVSRDDSGGQSARTGSRVASGEDDGGCPTSRFLVGAGWGPVRTCGVLRSHSDERRDGERSNLRHEVDLLPTPRTSDTNGAGAHGQGGMDLRTAVSLLPTPRATDDTKGGPNQRGSSGDLMLPSAVNLLPTPAVNDMGEGKTVEAWDEWTAKMKAAHGNGNGHGASLAIEAQRLLPTPTVVDSKASGGGYNGQTNVTLTDATVRQPQDWGQYAAAIHRWESITRPAPAPTELGAKGQPRLSARFSEWMMGLPDGWITDAPGITRNEALKAAGNGVVPQQATSALRTMLAHLASEVAA